MLWLWELLLWCLLERCLPPLELSDSEEEEDDLDFELEPDLLGDSG